MVKSISFALLLLSISLSGCKQDYSLAPPSNSEQITVTVKVPKELKARALQVMYRSEICKRITHGASGQRIELEGYHGIDVLLQREGRSSIYSIQLPKDGGGSCQWRLSNVTFGVTYGEPANFGDDIAWGAGGGVVVIFDHNNSPRGGADHKVKGDLTITKDYYPWLDEHFIGGHTKAISLLGEVPSYFLSYEALQARKIFFEPVLHSDYLVTSVGPKIKENGNYATFIYPDGSVEAVARGVPNFLRLQTIRLNAEAKR